MLRTNSDVQNEEELQQLFENSGFDLENEMIRFLEMPTDIEKESNFIYSRNLKIKLIQLGWSAQDIVSHASYLDKDETGMIPIQRILDDLHGRYNPKNVKHHEPE